MTVLHVNIQTIKQIQMTITLDRFFFLYYFLELCYNHSDSHLSYTLLKAYMFKHIPRLHLLHESGEEVAERNDNSTTNNFIQHNDLLRSK